MDILYRKAVPEDARDLLEYLKTVGGETGNLTFGAEGLPFTTQEEEKYLSDLQNDPYSLMLLAMDGEHIVGNAAINGSGRPRIAHHRELAISVRESHWGHGIASSLMERLIQFCRDTNVEVIHLQVRSDNLRAKALYRKFGFEAYGTFKKFFKINGDYFDVDDMNLYL